MSGGGSINGKYFKTEKAYLAEWERITSKLMEMYPWLVVSGFCPGVSCRRKGDTHDHESFNIPVWAVYCMIGEPTEVEPEPKYDFGLCKNFFHRNWKSGYEDNHRGVS